MKLGRKLRIQAATGHRAAVIDIKPGLYLVAEMPEALLDAEFGVAPLIAPLMVTAATRALSQPPSQRGRGPLASLFRRRQRGPVRVVKVKQACSHPTHQQQPLALPGPVAVPAQAIAQVPDGFLVAGPNVGWADDADVAEAMGCAACEEHKA